MQKYFLFTTQTPCGPQLTSQQTISVNLQLALMGAKPLGFSQSVSPGVGEKELQWNMGLTFTVSVNQEVLFGWI